MTRNTQRRVEVACPILDVTLKTRVLWMLDVMYGDNTNAWDLSSDGQYTLREPEDPKHPSNSQEFFTAEAQSRAGELAEEFNELLNGYKKSSFLKRFFSFFKKE